MDAYDTTIAPPGFGLENTGVLCYINSFLQALVSCTAFTRAVAQNEAYLRRTRTGAAVFDFVSAFALRLAPGIECHSSRILGALATDLAVRRPRVRFGAGMQSASEALVHLLDMMEPPLSAAETGAERAAQSAASPITRLFLHRFRCNLHCRVCKKLVSTETDNAVTFNLFHLDTMRAPPKTVSEFSKSVRTHASFTEDYRCPTCLEARRREAAARGEDAAAVVAAPTAACRIYDLTMIPEIVFCVFNVYVEYGGVRRARYFPDRLEFPALDGGLLVFRLVAQVEHSGTLAGGHYWARGLRAGERVTLLNDRSASPSAFAPTPETYIVVYHYAGHEPAVPLSPPAPLDSAGRWATSPDPAKTA